MILERYRISLWTDNGSRITMMNPKEGTITELIANEIASNSKSWRSSNKVKVEKIKLTPPP